MDIELFGTTYSSTPEPLQSGCTGCIFENHSDGCKNALEHMDCTEHEVIWVKKDLVKAQDTVVDKTTELTFEDRLCALLREEALKNRKVNSIYVRDWTVDGKPLTLEIDYEYNQT